jgi:hypothetical protein
VNRGRINQARINGATAAAVVVALALAHFDPEQTTLLDLTTDVFAIDPEQTTLLDLTTDAFGIDAEQTTLLK